LAESKLDKINSPEDLKKLRIEELDELAQELRTEIIETVSRTGGHLASNLGTVELTLALHYLFDFLEDRIVWDVGHQAYSHKLLTGRKDRFRTLRQYKGISGFPKRSESPYDHFGVGHAGTAIAAAMGMAVQRDFEKKNHNVIAVVGDGSLTAGMALEGLNQAGHLDRNMIIILNNNDMSIAPNVGAMSGYLNKIIHGRALNKLRMDTELVLKKIPTLGPGLIHAARTVEHAIKRVFIPGTLFEELGLKYVGPIDGHDIEKMVNELARVKDLDGPVLFHVETKKGKGYKIAEANPAAWHGASTFDIKTGKPKHRVEKLTAKAYTDYFADCLSKLMESDERVVAITAAMPGGTGLSKVAEVFPERVFDVGITEQFAVTFAAGMAAEGYKPVCAIYSTFTMRAYDQVFHDVCLQDLPVLMMMDRAGIVGADGPTHHGLYDIPYLRNLPNIILMAPKDEQELRKMMKTALMQDHPVAIRYPRTPGVGAHINGKIGTIPIGKAEELSHGKDATIFAYGSMVAEAVKAAETLRTRGLSVGVVNARFVKPLDHNMVRKHAQRGARIITMEEGILPGGFGSAVMESLEENDLLSQVEVMRIGLPDRIISHGSRSELLKEVGLDQDSIVARIEVFLEKQVKSRLAAI
jgi:1-deoxy-D-xylulose-5-phosphate synthase